ncbi:microviridin/marinostatin family tricyclic proteinase inhibitor [Mastigocladopsis repens]|uniref:microviridin/marinostatin family tricyclic proteinase inhibitor n=1 Tax=Mastigocladopsis repens TaxID=221287 RepID=UPI00031029B0|nr:microviridin/marinostatin family tricyclic proteinase inhibitor [Mastigocladopsis repens]
MSKNHKQNLKQEAVPFFARYLEGQIIELSEEEMQAVVGGKKDIVTTQKYPSDSEEDSEPILVTQKYPSDNDDSTYTIE